MTIIIDIDIDIPRSSPPVISMRYVIRSVIV